MSQLARDIIQNALDRRREVLDEINDRIWDAEVALDGLKAQRQDALTAIGDLMQGFGRLGDPGPP